MPDYKSTSQRIFKFISGENSGDALRNVLTSIVPSIVIFYWGYLDIAITVGISALLSSLTDLPGNRKDKWKSAFWCILLFFVASMATAYALSSPWLLLPLLIIGAFICTMLSVFGMRMGIIGTLVLILISFTIGLWPADPMTFSVQITLGTMWYYVVSIVQVYISPYRSLRHAMSDGFRSIAALLRAKALCYDERIPIEAAYNELGRLHIQVSEQQETIRFLLLREKNLMKAEDGKFWLNQAYGLIDLYELLTALDYDYESIRKTLGPVGGLKEIRQLIGMIADEIESLTKNYRNKTLNNVSHKSSIDQALNQLIAVRDQQDIEATSILSAIIENIRSILDFIFQIRTAFNTGTVLQNVVKQHEHKYFLSLPPKGWRALKKQITFHSTIFPFALRLAVLFGVGGLVGLAFPEYRYTYWILLTIAIVARPGFATTQKRNYQRIIGTLTGILLGLLLLYTIADGATLLIVAAVCLYGFFLFNRPNYLISVLFITAAIVIALNSYEGNIDDILGSRIAFTLIGSLLAAIGYFFIPTRQKKGMLNLAGSVVRSNSAYFQVVMALLKAYTVDMYSLRLARKKAQTALAAFSDATNQLQKEPGSKKKDWSELNKFHMLAYRINSLIVGLSLHISLQNQSDLKSYLLEDRGKAIGKLLVQLDELSTALLNKPTS
ncbi:FUSC family protein [Sphingobacterium alkalisoli]|uniref:FUSC family protein n=1 Tax=Sphingobacterium alkalisoli TaxID=1874115 RepID=A0A4U0H5G0_9SPHI|nr:FUSC family membrane protein [Sphingobacterium alkalisoli]TJY66940.1 FUSC family protein [Sphingobacterium alkalisoli]GGH13255.1 membrane protein [Sphingobacterium alkalisoli]